MGEDGTQQVRSRHHDRHTAVHLPLGDGPATRKHQHIPLQLSLVLHYNIKRKEKGKMEKAGMPHNQKKTHREALQIFLRIYFARRPATKFYFTSGVSFAVAALC